MTNDLRLPVMKEYSDNLCDLYNTYNRREFVHPDPLEFLYDYDDPEDREIVGLISSCLAYGSVWQILKTVRRVLDTIGPPRKFLLNATHEKLLQTFKDFKYRFTKGEELATMLFGVGRVIRIHGSVRNCFLEGYSPK